MARRDVAIGLAMLGAAAVALPTPGEAGHEHWFFDSYQAHEYQAYPYGYYQPPQPGRWGPYQGYVPPPAYRPPPRRWSPSATPPRYWFPPTVPPRRWQPSAPPRDTYEARRRIKPPIPKSKPEGTAVAATPAPAARSESEQRPAEPDVVTGSLPQSTSSSEPPVAEPPVAEPRVAEPRQAERRPAETDVAATSASEVAGRTEQRLARQTDGISCEAAAGIIGDFGFSDVRPTSCEGKVYDFEATRDGQGYSIKLSAADGELTEVRKR